MFYTITINVDSPAFQSSFNREIIEILYQLSRLLENYPEQEVGDKLYLMDSLGNNIGEAKMIGNKDH